MHHTDIDLDTASRVLSGPKGTVELQPKTSELLAYLMSHPEEAVAKEELLKRIWTDTVVTEGSLTRAMSILRKHLQGVGGDSFLAALHTVRGFGYRLEADATASDGPSAWARESFVAGRLSMIRAAGLPESCLGRQEEAQQLLGHVDTAIRRRQPQLSFVTGPPGIGKTFLLRELATQLQGNEVTVGWGRAPESGHRPLWPWMEWIQHLSKVLPDVRVPENVRAALEQVEARWNRSSMVDASQVRVALLHDLVTYLRACSEHTPLLLILEDAHWCDGTSLEALQYTVDHLDPAAVSFIATYRDMEVLPKSTQEQHLRQLRRSRVAQPPLQLAGLDDESTKSLVERVSGKAVNRRVAQRIRRRTEGNPLFVEVLVRFHQEETGKKSTFDPSRFVRWVPESLRTLVQKRIERLPDSAQDLLTAGAVLGRGFSTASIATMTGHPVEDAAARMALAEDEGLVVRFGEGTWRFRDGSVRDAVLASLSERERTRRHAAAAKMLEEEAGDLQTPGTIAALAYHYGEAGAAGSPERAIGYCVRAGRSSMERLAFEEAVEHLQRGVQTLDAFTPQDQKRKASLLADLAEASFHAYGGERYNEAAWESIRFSQQLGLAPLVGETASRMSHRRIANVGVAPAERVRALEWALANLAESERELRAQVVSALSFDLYWSGDFERIRALNQEGLELAREAGSKTTEFNILVERWGLFLHPDDAVERRALLDQVTSAAADLGSVSASVHALGRQLADTMEAGDRTAFDATLTQLDSLGPEAQEPLCQSTAFAGKAMQAFFRGEFDLAEELADEEHTFRVLATSEGTALPFNATFMFMLRLAQGRIAELEPLLAGGASAYPRAVAFQLALAMCYAETNRPELARKTLSNTMDKAEARLMRRDANQHVNLGLAAEVAARTKHAGAEKIAAWLEPFRGRQLTMENVGCMGFADRCVGLLEASLGHDDKAERSLRRALELELGFGSVPGRAYAAMDLGEFLAERGASAEEVDQYIELARTLIVNHDIRRLELRLKKAMSAEMSTKQVRM